MVWMGKCFVCVSDRFSLKYCFRLGCNVHTRTKFYTSLLLCLDGKEFLFCVFF